MDHEREVKEPVLATSLIRSQKDLFCGFCPDAIKEAPAGLEACSSRRFFFVQQEERAKKAARLMGYFASVSPIAKHGPAQFWEELMEREYEILTLIAQRKSNADIAAHLVLSPKTVRNHVSNILSKLQVADRTEAMHAAWTAGLGRRDGETL